MLVKKILGMIFVICVLQFFSFQSCRPQTAAQIYYQDKPWAYLETKFIDEPESDRHSFGQLLIGGGIYFASMIATGIGMGILARKTGASKKDAVGIVPFGMFIGMGLGLWPLKSYCSWKCKRVYLTALKKFLDRYDPDLTKLGSSNTKLYVPQELHKVFDALWEEYKDTGDSAIKSTGFEVLNQIEEEIKYNKKPKKYERPPVTHVHPVVINRVS